MNMQRVFAMGLRWVVVSLGMVMLSSCGGGGGGGTIPDANPVGFYGLTGSATIMTDSTPVALDGFEGIVYKNHLIMFSRFNQRAYAYDGTISVFGNSFSGNVSVYHNGSLVSSNVPIDGEISQGVYIKGNLRGTAEGVGTFTLNYDALANSQPVPTNKLNSVYCNPVAGSANTYCFNITNSLITPDTNVVDSVFATCDMNGSLSPLTNINLYSVDVVFTNCTGGANNTSYTGLAAYFDDNGKTRLAYVVSDGSYLFGQDFN